MINSPVNVETPELLRSGEGFVDSNMHSASDLLGREWSRQEPNEMFNESDSLFVSNLRAGVLVQKRRKPFAICAGIEEEFKENRKALRVWPV